MLEWYGVEGLSSIYMYICVSVASEGGARVKKLCEQERMVG